MDVYLIAFELLNPTSIKNREAIGQLLQKTTGAWWHYIDSVWLVASNDTSAAKIYDSLEKLMVLADDAEVSDNLFIIKVDPSDKQGFLDEDAWKWLDQVATLQGAHEKAR